MVSLPLLSFFSFFFFSSSSSSSYSYSYSYFYYYHYQHQVDPSGERTIGVLTKPDLIGPGNEEEVVAVLTNTRKPLRLGYVMVKVGGGGGSGGSEIVVVLLAWW